MSVPWPAALPMPQFGLRYSVSDPQQRTLMASGRTIVRRRFSDVPTEFSARWILTALEAQLFEQFYQNDVVDGTEWIEMPLITAQGEGVHFVRFRGAYQYRRLGPGLWEYLANLQMYLRPASVELPPNIGGGGPDPEPPVVVCGTPVDYEGGQSFPTSTIIVLGPDSGVVTLRCQSYSIPDKFEVWIAGTKVLDTGYIGDPFYQGQLDTALAARGLPLETINEQGTGNIYFNFVKSTADTAALVRVYAPLGGTAWNFRLGCPYSTTWYALPRGLNTSSTAIARVVRRGKDGVWIAGFSDGRAARSTDNGNSWTALTRGLNSGTTTEGIYAIETDGNGVWVALIDSGWAARSINNGATWSSLPRGLGLTNSFWTTMATDGNGVWIASNENLGDTRSVDNGATWAALPTGLNSGNASNSTYRSATDGNGVWIVIRNAGWVSRSADGGATWSALTRGLNSGSNTVNGRAIQTDKNGVWVVGFASGWVARSTDNGVTWAALTRGLNSGNTTQNVLMLDTDFDGTWIVLFGSTFGARSIDNGATWTALPRPLVSGGSFHEYTAIKTDRNGNWFIGGSDGSAHFSTDNGATWSALPASLNGGGVSTAISLRGVDTDGSGTWIAGMSGGYVSRSLPA